VIENAFSSFNGGIKMRRRGNQTQASERLRRRAFGSQIDEKGYFSGLSSLIAHVAAANFGLRMRLQTTVLW
jgi:hypothetical protein